MKISPATEFSRADLKAINLFADLTDEQIDWLRENGEHTLALKDTVSMRRGDPADHMIVLISGAIQWKFGVGGQTTVFVETEPGTPGGMLPYSRAKTHQGDAVAVEDSVGYRIHKDRFHDMLYKIPQLGQRLVAAMSDRIKRSTQIIDQREKMSALGKLAAGLAHELNNPASALKRSASDLREQMNALLEIGSTLMTIGVEKKHIHAAAELRDTLMSRTRETELSSIERGELEDEIADWLEEHKVKEPWVVAENLADMGATIEELNQFAESLADVAHAMPLGLRWIEGSAGAHRCVEEILSAAERITHLVQSIKVHAHMDSNPDKQDVDIRDGIESTLTILNHKIRKKSINVAREYGPDVPRVPAYPGELNQVWTNLIDNAIDAMEEGGRLTITTAREAQCVCARICDDGNGIPEDIQKQVFEPFFTTKSMGEGTGLGLDIVHRIVTVQHGGDIELESRPGYTCFTVWFPLTPKTRMDAE